MATISHLPVSLGLVHIPRSRLSQLSHPVIHQIIHPNPGFLNITCNEIELTIFAEHHMLRDFEPISRRDRRKQRSGRRNIDIQPIEVTYESWSVLQIDSHNDQMGNSGARVNELSAPLAEAGISILYQSSYMSDFIFVKETRLQEAMRLFASAGFDLYSAESNVLASYSVSPSGSPLTDDRSSIAESSAFGSVLTRSRSSTDPQTPASEPQDLVDHEDSKGSRLKNKSRSPTSGQVDVLSPDLICVGLSDDHVEQWTLKIIKLVAFPDLIVTTSTSGPYDLTPSYDPFTAFPTPRPPKLDIPISSSPDHSDTPSSSSTFSSDDEEGYFSHSPLGNLSSSSLVTSAASKSFTDLSKFAGERSHRQSISEGSISSRSSRSSNLRQSSKHMIITPITAFPSVPPSQNVLGTDEASIDTPTQSPQQTPGTGEPQASPLVPAATISFPRSRLLKKTGTPHPVPFFSFTRTPEGSSLTTSVNLLATLFPPSERHMVICGGELALADERISGKEWDNEDENEVDAEDGTTLKCLQIDLRKYGLDKHGLVNRFSRVLEDNGINHMYSATFKTANLLVDKKHARRAQALLRNC